MDCTKCKATNPEAAQFCVRCHATLFYKCPSCAATQQHGGKCDRCGVDFAKYAAMLIAQEEMRTAAQREKLRASASIWKQMILLPVTGGYSLIKFLLRRER